MRTKSPSQKGRLPRLPSGYELKDIKARIAWIKDRFGFKLKQFAHPQPSKLKGLIENQAAFVPVPMGVAGPLLIHGNYANGSFCVPLCTIEGTLVASTNRGMYAATLSGGIHTQHIRQELSRAPGFVLDHICDLQPFIQWVDTNFDTIKAEAESTSDYAKLLRIDKYPMQNYVILDFVYYTANAAGQNMVTIATEKAAAFIKKSRGYSYFLESGFNSDKKASDRNRMLGRGHSVIAEVTLSNNVLRRILKLDIDRAISFQLMAPIVNSTAGIAGSQLHVANTLTAIYLATGQDVACVAENTVGYMQAIPVEGDTMTFRLTLPSLTIGTIGGGTHLEQQQQNLKLLGCDEGEYSSRKLAEIITASALATEISLIAAILYGDWASSHKNIGRYKNG